jgi:hypothetical protein
VSAAAHTRYHGGTAEVLFPQNTRADESLSHRVVKPSEWGYIPISGSEAPDQTRSVISQIRTLYKTWHLRDLLQGPAKFLFSFFVFSSDELLQLIRLLLMRGSWSNISLMQSSGRYTNPTRLHIQGYIESGDHQTSIQWQNYRTAALRNESYISY